MVPSDEHDVLYDLDELVCNIKDSKAIDHPSSPEWDAAFQQHVEVVAARLAVFESRLVALEACQVSNSRRGCGLSPSQEEGAEAPHAMPEAHHEDLVCVEANCKSASTREGDIVVPSFSSKTIASDSDMRSLASDVVAVEEADASCSIHQAVAYYCHKANYPAWKKTLWLLSDTTLLTVQVLCIISLTFASFGASCRTNEQCELEGSFCNLDFDEGAKFLCTPCAYAERLTRTTNSTEFCRNNPSHSVCSGCSDTLHHSWLSIPISSWAKENWEVIRYTDQLALLFALFVVSLDVAEELRGIALCRLTCRSLRAASEGGGWIWSAWLWVISVCRQYCLLPFIVMSVPFLVLGQGADVMSIFFNTLGVLFMLKVDDLAFDVLLSRKAQTEILQSSQVWPEEKTSHVLLANARLVVILVGVSGVAGIWLLLNSELHVTFDMVAYINVLIMDLTVYGDLRMELAMFRDGAFPASAGHPKPVTCKQRCWAWLRVLSRPLFSFCLLGIINVIYNW